MHPAGFSSEHGFVEVADRCWLARQPYLDVNLGVVAGERGLLVVDSHASQALARPVVDQVRRLAAGEVVAVVNTHAHFDHFFGNAAFEEAYAGVAMFAHDTAASAMPAHAERIRRSMRPDELYYDEVTSSRLVVPAHTFSSARVVDLGDRQVELIHPGRGHTAGDVVVRVPDADVLFTGDLVEESTLRHGVPGFGEDCYPLEWPATLDLVVSMLSEASVVLPGHGLPVDKDFVQEQRSSIGIVAETLRDLAERGVRPADMATAGDWPYPVEELANAFARGFEQAPRSGKGLPLL